MGEFDKIRGPPVVTYLRTARCVVVCSFLFWWDVVFRRRATHVWFRFVSFGTPPKDVRFEFVFAKPFDPGDKKFQPFQWHSLLKKFTQDSNVLLHLDLPLFQPIGCLNRNEDTGIILIGRVEFILTTMLRWWIYCWTARRIVWFWMKFPWKGKQWKFRCLCNG